ncbi:MAG: hypothetical protein LC749_16765 [Actinobacteria bacterium]|nr:hypothetical protein [Actinomycetota bacterium]
MIEGGEIPVIAGMGAGGLMPLLWLVMREWLDRVIEHVNRWETDAVARRMELPLIHLPPQ